MSEAIPPSKADPESGSAADDLLVTMLPPKFLPALAPLNRAQELRRPELACKGLSNDVSLTLPRVDDDMIPVIIGGKRYHLRKLPPEVVQRRKRLRNALLFLSGACLLALVASLLMRR